MTAGLRHSPLLYVFLDIADLPRERALLEGDVRLGVIEIERHLPHERHGVVKYDAGGLILSLNLSTPGKFRGDASDALVTVLDLDPAGPTEAGGSLLTDPWGHHFVLRHRAAAGGPTSPVAAELRLAVDDVQASVPFYGERLGLDAGVAQPGTARFRTATVDLLLEPRARAVDGRALDRRTVLIVFHTHDIEAARAELLDRGVVFDNRRVARSRIGGTIRFTDPSGHRFCLYEPSPETLLWGSGAKVIELSSRAVARG
jgi:predicted enzyme related to lactoylglutathione lyase